MDFLKKQESVYEEIKNTKNPVWIWGAGSMAEVIEKRLNEHGIFPKGNFINLSDIEVDNEKLWQLKELEEAGNRIDVIVGHGKLDLVKNLKNCNIVDKIYVLDSPYEQYWPDVKAIKKLEDLMLKGEIRERIYDNKSYECVNKYVEFYNGKMENNFFEEVELLCEDMFEFEKLNLTENENYIDVGAWDGDTVIEFLKYTKGKYNKIYAIEPDDKGYNMLSKKFKDSIRISLLKMGLSSTKKTLYSSKSNTQSMHLIDSGEGKIVECNTLDYLLDNNIIENKPTLIKTAVPFMDLDVLRGAEKTIRMIKPRLICNISTGNKEISSIIEYILGLNLEYKIAFRYRLPVPTQLLLYAF